MYVAKLKAKNKCTKFDSVAFITKVKLFLGRTHWCNYLICLTVCEVVILYPSNYYVDSMKRQFVAC